MCLCWNHIADTVGEVADGVHHGPSRLQGLRRWTLATRDAHGLYTQFGFTPLKTPERYMELHDPEVYKRDQNLRG